MAEVSRTVTEVFPDAMADHETVRSTELAVGYAQYENEKSTPEDIVVRMHINESKFLLSGQGYLQLMTQLADVLEEVCSLATQIKDGTAPTEEDVEEVIGTPGQVH